MKFMLSSACCLLATQPMAIAADAEMSALAESTLGTAQTLPAAALSITRIISDIMIDQGKCGKYTVHNLDAVAGLIQGLDDERRELTKFIHPAELLSPLLLSQLSATEKAELYAKLPSMPSEIKESATSLMMQVFVFCASAFGKDTSPVYVYATRLSGANEPVNTTWKDELNALDGKVAKLEKKFGYIRAIDISLDINVGQTEYDRISLSESIFKSLFLNLVDYYQFFADFGVLEMQNSLGCMLLVNSDDRTCLDGALKYLKMAVVNGHKNAQHNYGTALGEAGFSEDAFFYFQIAADHGNMVAQHNCGVALLNGIGVARDTKRAFKYFKMSAENGFKDAQDNCALMFENNDVDSEDLQASFAYYKLSAEQGNIEAQFKIGVIFDNGINGIPINKTEAFRFYKMAASKGNMLAQYNCGTMLYKGEGIGINLAEAFKYYQMAAVQGYMTAQYNCGLMLEAGEGVNINLSEAFKYFKMAADLGYEEAQYECGSMFFKGEGIQENRFEATVYFIRAARQGNLNAISVMHQFMPETWPAPDEQ